MSETYQRHYGGIVNHKLFETNIFLKDFENFKEENQIIKKKLYDLKESDPKGMQRSNQLGWHSQLDILNYKEFDNFKDKLFFALQEIFTFYDLDPKYRLIVESCWGNISPPNAYNNTHTHPNAILSGVYYVQIPENTSNIYFVDPIKSRVHLPMKHRLENNMYASSSIYYKAIESRLIIFPSFLEHFVKPNMTKEDRISISFNVQQVKI